MKKYNIEHTPELLEGIEQSDDILMLLLTLKTNPCIQDSSITLLMYRVKGEKRNKIISMLKQINKIGIELADLMYSVEMEDITNEM